MSMHVLHALIDDCTHQHIICSANKCIGYEPPYILQSTCLQLKKCTDLFVLLAAGTMTCLGSAMPFTHLQECTHFAAGIAAAPAWQMNCWYLAHQRACSSYSRIEGAHAIACHNGMLCFP